MYPICLGYSQLVCQKYKTYDYFLFHDLQCSTFELCVICASFMMLLLSLPKPLFWFFFLLQPIFSFLFFSSSSFSYISIFQKQFPLLCAHKITLPWTFFDLGTLSKRDPLSAFVALNIRFHSILLLQLYKFNLCQAPESLAFPGPSKEVEHITCLLVAFLFFFAY